jgi:peptide/nickel transport system permease protein
VRRARTILVAFGKSALECALVLLILATAVFLALRLLPGDPAALVLGDESTAAEREELRHKLGLDAPLWLQYAHFLRGLAAFDFGESIRRPGAAAGARVLASLGPTAELAACAVLFGAIFGVACALLSAGPWLGERRRWVDRALVAIAATPLLAVAPTITFALAIRVRLLPLPGDPDAGLAGLLFAGGLLGLPLGAHTGRIGAAALEDLRGKPFLRVAQAKGMTHAGVWLKHALPCVTGPIVTVLGTQLGALLGGAVVIERLFERRGLGTLMIEAYFTRDLPVLEASIVAGGLLFVVTQALAGALHAAVDPRVRT